MEGLQIGRDVHYVLLPQETRHGQPYHRAAKVVVFWGEGMTNLAVFMDGTNDCDWYGPTTVVPVYWATSRRYSAGMEPGTWHWVEPA